MDKVRVKIQSYSPEQARAMGKTLGPLMTGTILDWLARVSGIQTISKEDISSLVTECMAREDTVPYL